MTTHKLLFVDPDMNALDAYRRLLKSMRPNWSGSYAANGREAIQIMRKSKPDVLVTELKMTIENDADLLKAVQKFYPDVIRIVLSSESDAQAETILRATQSAHRFLAKPCKGVVLLAHIEQAVELRKILFSEELRKIIGGIPYLPSLPQLYHELLKAMESPMVSVADLGDIIARDVSMTTRVLHLVNSAFFGLPRQVSNPRDAAVMLGLNVLKSLILYVKLFFAAPDSKIPAFLSMICGNTVLSPRASAAKLPVILAVINAFRKTPFSPGCCMISANYYCWSIPNISTLSSAISGKTTISPLPRQNTKSFRPHMPKLAVTFWDSGVCLIRLSKQLPAITGHHRFPEKLRRYWRQHTWRMFFSVT